ncbi:amino acid efflux transporter [Actinopolyspora biskrensis]|uniref:Amino acid efflux transporter n=1 Tax=Actinopolyspora biskrensis TaxID=1470178 RepID=A0A852Z4K0_9ACTN|nr:amino acid permease [Actinopolyspora biskrensis]NYH80235.1 amino acid efflux transporter [Actinopolyspora biskrensis]
MPQGMALYVGAVLGTGVLTLPALAAELAGPASLLAWLGLVVLSVPLATTFAVLATRFPDSGGVSTYVRRAFGKRISAVVGWWFFIGAPLGMPALALFGASYLAEVTHGGQGEAVAYAAAMLTLGFASNAFGVRLSGKVQLLLTGTLALLLVTAVVVAVPHAREGNLEPFAPHGWAAVGSAAALLMWSFNGWETVTHLSGEFANPKRDIKRATVGALVVIGSLYLLLAAVTTLALGESAGKTATPLAALLELGLGSTGPVVAAFIAVLVTSGTINAYVAGTSKLAAALARDGALPRYFAPGAETGAVPLRSLIIVAVMTGSVFSASILFDLDVQTLVLSSTACIMALYVVGASAGIRILRYTSRAGTVSAATALVLLVVLSVLTGWYLLWPLGIAAAWLLVAGRGAAGGQLAQVT